MTYYHKQFNKTLNGKLYIRKIHKICKMTNNNNKHKKLFNKNPI